MYEIKKCGLCFKSVECGVNPKDYVNHPFSVLSIYKIDEYADMCEDIRGINHRDERNIILCKKCYDFVRSLFNERVFKKVKND